MASFFEKLNLVIILLDETVKFLYAVENTLEYAREYKHATAFLIKMPVHSASAKYLHWLDWVKTQQTS